MKKKQCSMISKKTCYNPCETWNVWWDDGSCKFFSSDCAICRKLVWTKFFKIVWTFGAYRIGAAEKELKRVRGSRWEEKNLFKGLNSVKNACNAKCVKLRAIKVVQPDTKIRNTSIKCVKSF